MRLFKVTVSHDMIIVAKDEMEAEDVAIESYADDLKILPNLDVSLKTSEIEEITDINQLPSTRHPIDKPFGRNDGLNIEQILELRNFKLDGLNNELSLKEKFQIYQTLIKNDPLLKDKSLNLRIST